MSHPSEPDLAERIAGLSSAKRELLEQRLRARSAEALHSDSIQRRAEPGKAPLSFSQERIWFLDQLEGGGSSFNVPSAIRLRGGLQLEPLRRSLDEIVRRHATLRTRFPAVDGKPLQVIEDAAAIALPVVDLTRMRDSERAAMVDQLVREEARRPFRLAQGPVFRAGLLRLASDDHVFLLTLHHIISDGWSRTILFRELAICYEAFCAGREPALPTLPIEYADFAQWQQQWLQGQQMRSQLESWLERFRGELPLLELPTDRPRPAVQTLVGASRGFALTVSLQKALKDLGREEGATLFMTLLAAFASLLHRYTGQTDVIVGTLVANRNRVEAEGLIGIFINALPMRVDLSGNPSFRELLRRVKDMALAAYAHQDLPFEKLVEVLHPERAPSRPPLFQVMLNVQTGPPRTLRLPGLVAEDITPLPQTSLLDLTLAFTDREDELTGSLEYNTDLFEETTIDRMVGHLRILLGAIVASPDARLSALPILSDPERRRLLIEWNQTEREYPRDRCLPELFETQVEKTPGAVAVVFKAEKLTYRELNLRANRLASRLVEEGAHPDAVVGLLAERGVDFLTGVLGAFKAGAAYLPLDPLHPVGRIGELVRQSGLRVAMTTADLAPVLSEALQEKGLEGYVNLLRVDRLSEHATNAQAPSLRGRPRDLAYVIFTSGSTGVPKGAMIEQAGMLNHLYAKIEDLELTSSDSVAQTASQCFDISVWQLLAPLLVGGRVVILEDEIAHDPRRLLERIEEECISIVEVVPSVLRAMLESRPGRPVMPLARLRWMIVTGEALPAALAREWLTAYPRIPLLNAYGPTECSDDVTHYPIQLPPVREDSSVPIGRPIANTRLYILDTALSPVPVGIAGELCVGGTGVGRGYLNDPDRTAEVFVPDPYSSLPGTRLYRTGDLARYRGDGNIEFLGRMDHQVKVRGFRIELGEIESVLATCPGVAQAACVAHEDDSGDKRLVAYLVPGARMDPSVNEIRAFLKRTLPEYMVPTAFVLLESLPLTANGKLDRRRLPAPEENFRNAVTAHVPPRTAVEELLAGIWSDVLGREQVGIFEDFFEIGGHSLLVTQVVSRVRDAFHIELPLRAAFESPTVAGLAERIELALRAGERVDASSLTRVSRLGEIPLSFAQQRLWFFDQIEPDSCAYNIRRALRVRGPLDEKALRRSLEAIIERHEVLRTSFPARDGRPVSVIARDSTLELPVIELTDLPAEDRETEAMRLVNEEVDRSFDLTRSPLLRTRLLRLSQEEHILVLTIHHIVSDLWSLGVLFDELAALYEAFTAGKPSPLPDLPIQYMDFAVWQRESLSGNVLEEQLSYWRRQLMGAPELISLPTDRPRPAARTFRGARRTVAIPAQLTEALKALSRRERVTLYMTLLAGFAVLLSSYSGEEDVLIGSPVAGRNRVETEQLIGFFLNTLVLRVNLSGDPRFSELLGRVRETALGAYAHQDLPFERLVDDLRPARSLSHNPLFQVWLVLQNAPGDAAKLAGATLESLEIETTTARHDLQLTLWETVEGLQGAVDYSTDLFDDSTIRQLVDDLEILLGRIARLPDSRVSALCEALAEARTLRERRAQEELERSSRRALKMAKRKVIVG